MCGIAGIIDKADKNLKPNLDKMLSQMYKRGPDGEGTYFSDGIAIGMRRLSIIDIEGGQQPFYSSNQTVIAFQNGEIYNFKELTKELKALGYEFISHSDTEVIAHGYDAWGADTLFKKLDGMFAIAIIDKKINKLFLGRDKFGEKPLYYCYDKNSNKFAYCSDLRGLLKLSWISQDICPTALSRYLLLGFTTGEVSILKDIKKVLPAHYLCLDLSTFNINMSCFYLPNLNKNKASIISNKERLKKLLKESINIRLRADVPVGVFLSGGVDSSLIAALSAKKHPKINTFSIGFHTDKHDESKYAKQVANHIDSTRSTMM